MFSGDVGGLIEEDMILEEGGATLPHEYFSGRSDHRVSDNVSPKHEQQIHSGSKDAKSKEVVFRTATNKAPQQPMPKKQIHKRKQYQRKRRNFKSF